MSAKVMSWVVTYLMHSTLLILAVWIATRWVRNAAVRDALWKLALTGALLTATLQTAMPVRVWRAAPTPTVLVRNAPAADVATTPAVEGQAATAVDVAPSRKRWLAPPHSETILWSAIAMALIARLLYGRHRLLSILADRREIVAGTDRTLLDSLGAPRLVRLTESSSIASPMAMLGWEIVIPRGIFARLSDEQRRTILAHELAHLVRRDPLWLACGELIKAMLFFQPLNFLAAAKMKETAEFLCDDAAVLQTGDRQALAETLAELASSMVPMPASVAAMAEGGSNLIVRVTRVLRAHGLPDMPLKMRWRAAIALGPLALVALFAPGVAPALATKPMAALAAVTASAAKVGDAKPAGDGKFNHFTNGNLVHTYEGKEGFTRIKMDAKDVAIALDGSWIRFDRAGGYFRVHYTAEQGAERRVDVTPGPNLEPRYRYSVGGREQGWNIDARRLTVAAFRSRELDEVGVDGIVPEDIEPKMSEWNATIEETGTRDGVPLHIRVNVDSLFYNPESGEVDFERDGTLAAYERLGGVERGFKLRGDEGTLTGNWEGTTRRERQAWLSKLLRHHTTGDERVVRRIMALVP